jgi:hypothetical protein
MPQLRPIATLKDMAHRFANNEQALDCLEGVDTVLSVKTPSKSQITNCTAFNNSIRLKIYLHQWPYFKAIASKATNSPAEIFLIAVAPITSDD